MIEIPIAVFIVMLVLCLACCLIPVAQIVDRRSALRLAAEFMMTQRDEARREVCGSLPAQMSSPQVLANFRMGTADMRGWSYLYEEEKEWLNVVSIEPRIHPMYMKRGTDG